ncbi:MAG: PhnD/SsuA/transferrin family substrate-binding protein [Rhizobiaceae bacterium]|nr:PhnD/SsuA/transferrin family substrate-binding protein [Rhizobiaceae bacterium]
MTDLFVALPMYEWPETRDEVDAEWTGIRRRLVAAGINAPERLVRRNGDMPPVPGGIRDEGGAVIAPDPATLPPDELDLPTLWKHPGLLFGQTCWGPMELGLCDHVQVVGQPDYSAYEGGDGELYSSAILMRRSDLGSRSTYFSAPRAVGASIPLDLLRGKRLAFNGHDSMSGLIGLTRDLAQMGQGPDIFAGMVETGAHRASMVAVADGQADVCAIDCRSWDMAKRFEPRASELAVIGWTARRKGLPYLASRSVPAYRLPPAQGA